MTEPTTTRSRGPRGWLLWVAAGAALVVGGVAGGLIVGATQSSSSAANSHSPAASAGATTVSACPVTSVADRVIPSVVTIAASGQGGSGTGSGEVIRAGGYILTNNHVISIAAASGGSVEVLFADGQHAPATITGRDPLTDLAVLHVQTSRQLKVISLGSSSSVKVGQPVVAVGAPLGLSGTVTSGIVSALDRTVEVPGENDRSALLVSAVQTDASINPGNSGGALVNCESQLVGVPTAGAGVPNSGGGSIGLGFAIPVDLAKRVADEIIATGTVTHAFFGLQTVPIPPAAAEQAGLPEGLFVQAVTTGGPAATAGLRPGDVITKIDGEPATSNIQLQELTLTKKPGDTVPIEYSRDGQSATVTVTLAAQPWPDRVLTAGDTPNDLAAGMNAGAGFVVGVTTGSFTRSQLGAEPHTHILDSVAALPALPWGASSAIVATYRPGMDPSREFFTGDNLASWVRVLRNRLRRDKLLSARAGPDRSKP